MSRRRFRDLMLLVVACAVGGWWVQQPAHEETPAETLRELRYRELPFQYQLSVKRDGSATYNASLNCVMGTPAPGELGCQHLEGKVSSQQMKSVQDGLHAAHLERFPNTRTPRDYWSDPRLELEFDGHSMEMARSTSTEPAFKAMQSLQMADVRQRLETKRKNEAAALKKRHPGR